MHDLLAITPAMWQTGTALVQAICSIFLLGWYVLAAHLGRARTRREAVEDFHSLVRLCRDLGSEAKEKTLAHLESLAASTGDQEREAASPAECLASWRSDMTIIYVCLNEVPHYEVRNPAFSTALTRLWMEVDVRSVQPCAGENGNHLASFLRLRHDRMCVEVDAMARLLVTGVDRAGVPQQLRGKARRRGYHYEPDGSVRREA